MKKLKLFSFMFYEYRSETKLKSMQKSPEGVKLLMTEATEHRKTEAHSVLV